VQNYPSIAAMLASLHPAEPVYCVHPRRVSSDARELLDGFPGRVLFAVKANNDPAVLDELWRAGISHFDCASLGEIELVAARFPQAKCYFMSPARIPGAARDAFDKHQVRHFMVDDVAGIPSLIAEIDAEQCVIFARMAVHHESAVEDLSGKFGARPEHLPQLLGAIHETGAEPALAFNVGSLVRSPSAYAHAIDVAADVLSQSPVPVRLLDVGGGFPRSYPGFETPELDEFFAVIRKGADALPLAKNSELLAEPGRALCANGLSTVVRVLLRKDDRLYINDGMYGALWELRFDGHKQYAVRTFRDASILEGGLREFTIFGPTCDSNDRLPARIRLPLEIAEGDYIEFLSTGAYSLSGRTDFNGFHSSSVVSITQ
jgi:ornithine decarboxylase